MEGHLSAYLEEISMQVGIYKGQDSNRGIDRNKFCLSKAIVLFYYAIINTIFLCILY